MGKFLLPFHEGSHTIHTFSPTSIVLASLAMGVVLSVQTQVSMVLWLVGLILLIGTATRTRWRTVLLLAARFEAVILFWIILLPFIFGSTVVYSLPAPWGQLSIYQEGLELGLLIGLRILAIMTLFIAALSHLSLSEFIGALRTLRFPSSVLGSLLIMLRYIPLFIEERHRMQEAQQLRGFAHGERRGRVQSLGFLVGSTIDRAMVRSAVVYESMTLRGFGRGMVVFGAGLRMNDLLLFFGLVTLVFVVLNLQTLAVILQ